MFFCPLADWPSGACAFDFDHSIDSLHELPNILSVYIGTVVTPMNVFSYVRRIVNQLSQIPNIARQKGQQRQGISADILFYMIASGCRIRGTTIRLRFVVYKYNRR